MKIYVVRPKCYRNVIPYSVQLCAVPCIRPADTVIKIHVIIIHQQRAYFLRRDIRRYLRKHFICRLVDPFQPLLPRFADRRRHRCTVSLSSVLIAVILSYPAVSYDLHSVELLLSGLCYPLSAAVEALVSIPDIFVHLSYLALFDFESQTAKTVHRISDCLPVYPDKFFYVQIEISVYGSYCVLRSSVRVSMRKLVYHQISVFIQLEERIPDDRYHLYLIRLFIDAYDYHSITAACFDVLAFSLIYTHNKDVPVIFHVLCYLRVYAQLFFVQFHLLHETELIAHPFICFVQSNSSCYSCDQQQNNKNYQDPQPDPFFLFRLAVFPARNRAFLADFHHWYYIRIVKNIIALIHDQKNLLAF